MSKIKISIAGVDDAETIQQIAIQTFTESFTDFNTPENMLLYVHRNFNTETFKSALENENFLFLLIHFKENVVGYVKLKFNATHPALEDESVIEVERFYILNAYHRQGIGRKTLDYIIKLAKENTYDTIWLGVWEHNTKAIAFYEALGFIKFSNKAFVLGNDIQNDLCYKLQLTDENYT